MTTIEQKLLWRSRQRQRRPPIYSDTDPDNILKKFENSPPSKQWYTLPCGQGGCRSGFITIHERFGFVLAGGYVTRYVLNQNHHSCDLDLFTVDPSNDPDEVKKARATKNIFDCMRTLIDENPTSPYVISQSQHQCTITFDHISCDEFPPGARYQNVPIQFILRIFTSIEQLISGFDITLCGWAHAGRQFYATELAAWSAAHNTFLVDPARASPSFATRIVKYSNLAACTFVGIKQSDPHYHPFTRLDMEIEELEQKHDMTRDPEYASSLIRYENTYNDKIERKVREECCKIFANYNCEGKVTVYFNSRKIPPTELKFREELVQLLERHQVRHRHDGANLYMDLEPLPTDPDAQKKFMRDYCNYNMDFLDHGMIKIVNGKIKLPKHPIYYDKSLYAIIQPIANMFIEHKSGTNPRIQTRDQSSDYDNSDYHRIDRTTDITGTRNTRCIATPEYVCKVYRYNTPTDPMDILAQDPHFSNIIRRDRTVITADPLLIAQITSALRTLTWITDDPTRQYTASFHPTPKTFAEFYGHPVHPITDLTTIHTLWLMRRRHPFNIFPRDIMKIIVHEVLWANSEILPTDNI